MAERIKCDCCGRYVSPSKWDDDSGECVYCLNLGCVPGKCKRPDTRAPARRTGWSVG